MKISADRPEYTNSMVNRIPLASATNDADNTDDWNEIVSQIRAARGRKVSWQRG